MLWNRKTRANGRSMAQKIGTPRPFGGAIPAVQNRFERAQRAAEKGEFPLMASLIYAAPSIVALPVEYTSRGNGMVDRLYQPPAPEPERTFGDKLTGWFKSGRFA
jgi:hypothetical protein